MRTVKTILGYGELANDSRIIFENRILKALVFIYLVVVSSACLSAGNKRPVSWSDHVTLSCNFSKKSGNDTWLDMVKQFPMLAPEKIHLVEMKLDIPEPIL